MKKKGNKINDRAETFFGLCEEKLRPLTKEYGLVRADEKAGRGYTYYMIVFKNETTALRIYFEWMGSYLEVMLCRLVDGNLGTFHETLTPNVAESCFHTEDLLNVRAPGYNLEALQPRETIDEADTMKEVERRLAKYADALCTYGEDILRGDFGVFAKLDKIAKRRSRQTAALEQQWDLQDYG